MTYDQLIRYIFSQENQVYEARKMKWRNRQFLEAKHISMTLGEWFFNLSNSQTTNPFGNDHSTFNHTKKTVQDLRDTDKHFAAKYDRYLNEIRNMINIENAIKEGKCNTESSIVTRQYNNTTLQLESTVTGYILRSSIITNGAKVTREMTFTYEGMQALVDAYCEIHNLVIGKRT